MDKRGQAFGKRERESHGRTAHKVHLV
jgi:hypothetical protein